MINILASDLTVEQIQNGIVIVDQDTKDYAGNVIEWQILGKNQDGDNTITVQTKTLVGDGVPGYGTAVGNRRYDPSRNILNSELQTWLDNDFYNHLGSDFRSKIIPVMKSVTPYQSSDIASQECKLFNLSMAEVGGGTPSYYSPESGAFTYQYYQSINSTSSNTKRVHSGGSNSVWWLRSPGTDDSYYIWIVSSNGSLGHGSVVYYTGDGPSPACVLPSSIQLELIDGETNKYNIVWNNSGSGNSDPSQDPDPTPSPTPSDSNAKNFVSYENMYNILNNLNIGNNKITVDSTTETMIFN